jgi:hypothetical protein
MWTRTGRLGRGKINEILHGRHGTVKGDRYVSPKSNFEVKLPESFLDERE